MAEKTKFMYQDALDLAHKTAEEEQKTLPEYHDMALWVQREMVDILWEQVIDLESALQFMINFELKGDERSTRDKRWKKMLWEEMYGSFCSILNVSPEDSAGKKWPFNIVKTACGMIYWTTRQDFLTALDTISTKKGFPPKCHEFLEAVYKWFKERGYFWKKVSWVNN